MSKITPKKARQLQHLREIKHQWYLEGKTCFFCGQPFDDIVHIIRRSYSDELYDDTRNLIPGCRSCHKIFDDGSKELKRGLKKLNEVLDIMAGLDPYYAERFKQRL